MSLPIPRLKAGLVAGALLLVAGLALALETRPAAAAPGTPIPLSARAVSPTTIEVHFRDTAEEEASFYVRQVRPETSTPIVASRAGLDGRGAEAVIAIDGLSPNTEYCFQMIAGSDRVEVFGDPVDVWADLLTGLWIFDSRRGSFSDQWSGSVCATTPPPPPPSPIRQAVALSRVPFLGVGTNGAAAISAPPPAPAPAPDAPADFTATLTESGTRIVLSWTAAEEATRYELRGSNEDSGLFFTKTLHKDATSYADEIGANQSGDFVYELQACAAVCSAPATVTVAARP